MSLAHDQLLAGGAYARKQLFCKDRIVAWSHGSRFRLGRRLAEPYAGRQLLDYGCGDGTFLALVHDLFPVAVGADVDPKQTADCTRRFAGVPGLCFVLTEDLSAPCHSGTYGVLFCMEVLEHCTEDKLHAVLDDMRRLLAPDGTAVVSVPVETGPSLLGKQIVRRVAGWRGLGDYRYRETYRTREFWKMVFAGDGTAIQRPVYRADVVAGRPMFYHGHKGFNWRALRHRLQAYFRVEQTRFSPLGWLGGYFSSQAWFICKPR
ncbi:MAG TPA: class I SAM-dependent methyltransferase [Gemmataceae bacterium]|jgi:2-polyprenyl-3-methyl-5-hydroxy-6-metoxy-1,4-benzoquinol methylase|nr:class I SAM-dependent methyltransferase [Gemmataceae bacterium]